LQRLAEADPKVAWPVLARRLRGESWPILAGSILRSRAAYPTITSHPLRRAGRLLARSHSQSTWSTMAAMASLTARTAFVGKTRSQPRQASSAAAYSAFAENTQQRSKSYPVHRTSWVQPSTSSPLTCKAAYQPGLGARVMAGRLEGRARGRAASRISL